MWLPKVVVVVVAVVFVKMGVANPAEEFARWRREAFPEGYDNPLEFEASNIPLLNKKHVSYDFAYSVRDDDTGAAYSHEEERNGKTTRGEYRVSLPDGRIQIVSYVADENGYRAKVSYEPVNPSPIVSEPLKYAPRPKRPQPPQGYGRRRRPRPYRARKPKILHRPQDPHHHPHNEAPYHPEPTLDPYHASPSPTPSPFPPFVTSTFAPASPSPSIPNYVPPKTSYLPTPLPYSPKPSDSPYHSTPLPPPPKPSPTPYYITPTPYGHNPSQAPPSSHPYNPVSSTPLPPKIHVSDPTTIPNYITPANHPTTIAARKRPTPARDYDTSIELPEDTYQNPKPQAFIPTTAAPRLPSRKPHIVITQPPILPTPIPYRSSPYPTPLPHSLAPFSTPLPHRSSPYPTPSPHSPSPYSTPLPHSPSPFNVPYTPTPPPYPIKTPFGGLSTPAYGGPSPIPFNPYRAPFFGPQYGPKFPGPSYAPRIPGFPPFRRSGPLPPRSFFPATLRPVI